MSIPNPKIIRGWECALVELKEALLCDKTLNLHSCSCDEYSEGILSSEDDVAAFKHHRHLVLRFTNTYYMNSLEIDIPWQEKNKFSCHVIVKNILKHVIDYDNSQSDGYLIEITQWWNIGTARRSITCFSTVRSSSCSWSFLLRRRARVCCGLLARWPDMAPVRLMHFASSKFQKPLFPNSSNP